MKISSVVFSKSISIESQKVMFDEKSQVVFIGRSNVGKSSLMNKIFSSKDLVKTSSMPGKTRLANLFLVNNKFYFTDLPGYGFAKLGEENRAKIDALISWYFEEFQFNIKKVVVVIDSKLGPTDTDIDMYKYLQEIKVPLVFVLNKIDRLSKNEVFKSLSHTQEIFFGQKVIPLSAKNWDGVRELEKDLFESLTAK